MSSDIEELGSDSNSQNDEEVDAYLMKMRQGVSFPFHFLKYINEEVDKLPPEINGSRKYKIKATISNYTELVKDRRWFKMSRSTVADPQTLRRVGKCGGSFVCNNKTCSFLSTQGEKNTSNSYSPVVLECAILVGIVQQVHLVMLENLWILGRKKDMFMFLILEGTLAHQKLTGKSMMF